MTDPNIEQKFWQYMHPIADVTLSLESLRSSIQNLSGDKKTDQLKFIYSLCHSLIDVLKREDPTESEKIKKEIQRDKIFIQLVPVGLINELIQDFTNVELADDLQNRLSRMAVVVGEVPGMSSYLASELKGQIENVENSKGVSPFRFIHTLRQAILGQDTHAYAETIFPFFRQESTIGRQEITWEGQLAWTLCLHLFWESFPQLFIDDKEILLKGYIYRSLVVGCDIKDSIMQWLKNAPDPVEYVNRLGIIFSSLSNAEENIITNDQPRQLSTIGELYTIVKNKKLQKINDINNITNTYTTLLNEIKDTQPDSVIKIIAEIITLIDQVESGQISNETGIPSGVADSGEEQKKIISYGDELVVLIQNFFKDEAGWNNIARYMKQEKKEIKLTNFLDIISESVSLENSKIIEYVHAFLNFLKDQKLIPIDKEIIYFDEMDNQFHWDTTF